ncbi:PITH domain-containing protein [Xylogone sp. PMI_703]|nr:PITH domain-containing protein [Xylogone sp. PMI_703]
MSNLVHITSTAQWNSLLQSSRIVVTDFYADWCGPCKAIAPVYEQLASSLSRENEITFAKVNTDEQKDIAARYNVAALPTFMIFKQGQAVEMIQGADRVKLEQAVKKLIAEYSGGSSGFGESSGSGNWRGGELPKGYKDVTDQVDIKGTELLNADGEFGSVRVLFNEGKPSALNKGKGAESKEKDWVESDTDEQLMLFVPFQSTLKVHTIQLTSLPPQSEDDDDDVPMRPKTVNIYSNRPHILGFEEAEDIQVTQTITLSPSEWDATGTATIPLRFVKFQYVTSLVLFIVDGEGSGDKVRLDRVRIIGETGEKRELGKLEKIGDEQGE